MIVFFSVRIWYFVGFTKKVHDLGTFAREAFRQKGFLAATSEDKLLPCEFQKPAKVKSLFITLSKKLMKMEVNW